MQKSLVVLLVLFSTNVWASQLTCDVSEELNPPLQASSVKYTLSAPLSAPEMNARIDVDAQGLNVRFGIETFLSDTTSPGQQVILIGIADLKTDTTANADGHGFVETFYDTDTGELSIQCSVQ
jgi:hypothetical protein